MIGLYSAGAGHGNYFVAKILFPFTMLSTVIFDSIRVPFLFLAVAQFPLYGVILGVANRKAIFVTSAIIGLAIMHLLAVAACFLLIDENFS